VVMWRVCSTESMGLRAFAVAHMFPFRSKVQVVGTMGRQKCNAMRATHGTSGCSSGRTVGSESEWFYFILRGGE
jgi:hypothetical protein